MVCMLHKQNARSVVIANAKMTPRAYAIFLLVREQNRTSLQFIVQSNVKRRRKTAENHKRSVHNRLAFRSMAASAVTFSILTFLHTRRGRSISLSMKSKTIVVTIGVQCDSLGGSASERHRERKRRLHSIHYNFIFYRKPIRFTLPCSSEETR